jgi:hypothetical protein
MECLLKKTVFTAAEIKIAIHFIFKYGPNYKEKFNTKPFMTACYYLSTDRRHSKT